MSSETGATLTANENDLASHKETELEDCSPGDNDTSLVAAVASRCVKYSATPLDTDGPHDYDLRPHLNV